MILKIQRSIWLLLHRPGTLSPFLFMKIPSPCTLSLSNSPSYLSPFDKYNMPFPVFMSSLNSPTFINIITFILNPVLVDLIEVSVVKTIFQVFEGLVVEGALPIKLIVLPVSLIRNSTRLIEQFPIPIHFVLTPFPIVHSSILVVKFTMTMPFSIEFVPFIPTPSFKLLHNILKRCIGFEGSGITLRIMLFFNEDKVLIRPTLLWVIARWEVTL